jgi:hypothetical protein
MRPSHKHLNQRSSTWQQTGLATSLMPPGRCPKAHSARQQITSDRRRKRLSNALQAIREATSQRLQSTKRTNPSQRGLAASNHKHPQGRQEKRPSHYNPDNLRFSQSIRNKINAAIRGGWAPSTLKGYNGAVAQFLAFCDEESVLVKFRFPTSETVLCAFAASGLGRQAGSTVSNQLAGLKAWHAAWNAEWRGGRRLQYVLNGVEKMCPSSSRRNQRLPITREILRTLHRNLDLKTPFDAAVFAAACTLFWGQCRAGEVLLSTTTPAGCKGKPTRQDFLPLTNTKPCYSMRLPSTKTHFTDGETVILLHQKGSMDPIQALHYHLYTNQFDAEKPLFPYKTAHGSRPLMKSAFLGRCNKIWARNNLPRFTGHCCCIGGTTELLLAGVPPHVVKQSGRWSSDAFLRYWHSTEVILPLYMKRIQSMKRPGQE